MCFLVIHTSHAIFLTSYYQRRLRVTSESTSCCLQGPQRGKGVRKSQGRTWDKIEDRAMSCHNHTAGTWLSAPRRVINQRNGNRAKRPQTVGCERDNTTNMSSHRMKWASPPFTAHIYLVVTRDVPDPVFIHSNCHPIRENSGTQKNITPEG